MRTIGVLLALGMVGYGAGAWSVSANQRDPGALEEMFERLSKSGATIWRDGSRFLIQGELHELPREMGVNVQPWGAAMPANLARVNEFSPEASLMGTGSIVTLDHAENATFLAISFLLDRVEGVAWGADGTIVLDSAYASGSSARALNFARQFGLRVTMVERAEAVYELKRPRLNVMTREPWVSALLDRYNVPYMRGSGSDFDAMVLDDGDLRVDTFARGGGTAICIPGAHDTDSRLPAAHDTGFKRVAFDVKHPVAFGMPREEWARSGTAVLLSGEALARFSESHAAAITVERRGKGRVIAFAFRPDTYATCRLLLNAVYLGSARHL